MIHQINPEILAHNIANAFCQREILKMPNECFIPGDAAYSKPAIEKMHELYSNVYDVAFDLASISNARLIEEE